MRVAVISDIHGNLPALNCVVEDIAKQNVSEIWCLGDIIGYGAKPWECWRVVREQLGALVIRGNHEEMLFDEAQLVFFSHSAKAGVEFARKTVSESVRSEIKLLSQELSMADNQIILAHGSLTDGGFNYVDSIADALWELNSTSAKLIIVGHTHKPHCFARMGGEIKIGAELIHLNYRDRYLINPGSVGQPRDHDSRASYAILEIDGPAIFCVWRRVNYPIAEAAEDIRHADLPASLAERLFFGR